jgi:predicted aconitase with swiveling domain
MNVRSGQALVAGAAEANTMVMSAPLNLWDGLNPQTGEIIEPGHPEQGQSVHGRLLILRHGLSGATVAIALTEALRNDVGPAGVVLPQADLTVVMASVIAGDLYDRQIPVLQLSPEHMQGIQNDVRARVDDAELTLVQEGPAS